MVLEILGKHKRKFLLLFCFILMGVALSYIFLKKGNMDYQIKPSSLPQNQLWSIEYAEEMQKKAFNIGIPMVLDEAVLLELVKHAWQWDKNAMIQYSRIVENELEISPSEEESLDYFLRKHRKQIVDSKGKLLNEPAVLRIYFDDLMKLLADQQYPTPALQIAIGMMGDSGTNESKQFIPYAEQEAKKMENYIRSSIVGGYRNQEFLADTILFRTGFGSKDRAYEELNKLVDRVLDITDGELLEAINAYGFCAHHGSGYCAMRFAEAHAYGIGVAVDLEKAYAWGMLSNQFYDYFQEYTKNKLGMTAFGSYRRGVENEYNNIILEKVMGEMDEEILKKAKAMYIGIEAQILDWDYDTWTRGRDRVPPKP